MSARTRMLTVGLIALSVGLSALGLAPGASASPEISVVAEIPVTNPVGSALVGDVLYVVSNGNEISVIDTRSNTVVDTISTQGDLVGNTGVRRWSGNSNARMMVVVGGFLYVLNGPYPGSPRDPDIRYEDSHSSLAVIDLGTSSPTYNHVVDTVPVGPCSNLGSCNAGTMSASESIILVSNYSDGSVAVVDTADSTLGQAYNPRLGLGDARVTLRDIGAPGSYPDGGQSGTHTWCNNAHQSLYLGPLDTGGGAMSERFYVGCYNTDLQNVSVNSVQEFSVMNGFTGASLTFPEWVGDMVQVDGYIYALGTTSIHVVDPSTDSVIDTIVIPGMGFDCEGAHLATAQGLLYISDSCGILTVVDIASRSIVAVVQVDPTSERIDYLTARGEYVYVSGSDDSNLLFVLHVVMPASGTNIPTSPQQAYVRGESDSCESNAPDWVNWPGIASQQNASWGKSWQEWPNNHTGGWVCARQPFYTTAGSWSA